MSKTNLRRVLVLLVVIAMLFSITACNKSENSTPESKSVETDAKQNSQSDSKDMDIEDGPLVPYDEAVTVTWAAQASQVQTFFDGDNYSTNRWTKLIKEKLNIDVEVEFSADITTDAYRNKMNVLLATGEFPDVFRWEERTFFEQAYEAGYLADITDVFNEYATDSVKAYMEKYPDCFEGVMMDGRLYGFPYMDDNTRLAMYLWIRDDWLENTNSEVPQTVEEMVELAKTFTFDDPDGNGVDDTYGFAFNKNIVETNFGTLSGLFAAYGIPGHTDQGIFYRRDGGDITFAYIQPEVKEALKVAREMYEAGIIDKEFIVKDGAALETDIAQGTIGMMYHMCWGDWYPYNMIYEESGVITRPYPIPTVEGYEYKIGINSNKLTDKFMISANSEHPEAVIKILNLYNSLIYEETDPVWYNDYWANEQYRLCPIFVGIPTELHGPAVFDALANGTGDELPTAVKLVYDNVVGFEDGTKTTSDAYGTWGQLSERGSIAISNIDYTDDAAFIRNIMSTDMPDIWIQNSSVLGDMVNQAFTDIIIGAKPLDYFDEFVENWLAAGGQQTLDELEELYPAQ